MRVLAVAAGAVALAVPAKSNAHPLVASTATAKQRCHHHACRVRTCTSRACKQRVGARQRIRAWRAMVRPYRGWLDSTGGCEADSSGGYRLRTTGNGFWFRYQFTSHTWASVGGIVDRRVGPVGMHGELHPAPLEQDVRAVRALHQQGRGAWPVCG
jgi:hypothetical protein